MTDTESSVTIDFGDGDTLTFTGHSLNDLLDKHFQFA
jgi:hypothetical protein